ELIMADATAASPSMMNAAAADDRIPPRRLFAFLIMVFGMFMAVLDIQVVSASLQQIQAGLSASSSEVAWVPTSSLIAAVVATLAPTIGPTVGGFITDMMSWHWLFFINIVPGIAITIGVLALCDFDEPNFALLEHFDWWGLLFMASFLGTLEYVLEEGPQSQWLEDTSVAVCAAICAVSAIAFFWRVLSAREPIVDIRTFTDRNFGVGCLISFCVGIGLYGLTYIYPRYLAEVRGYSPLMIGEYMFVSGVAMILTAAIVCRL